MATLISPAESYWSGHRFIAPTNRNVLRNQSGVPLGTLARVRGRFAATLVSLPFLMSEARYFEMLALVERLKLQQDVLRVTPWDDVRANAASFNPVPLTTLTTRSANQTGEVLLADTAEANGTLVVKQGAMLAVQGNNGRWRMHRATADASVSSGTGDVDVPIYPGMDGGCGASQPVLFQAPVSDMHLIEAGREVIGIGQARRVRFTLVLEETEIG